MQLGLRRSVKRSLKLLMTLKRCSVSRSRAMPPSELTLSAPKRPVTLRVLDVRGFLRVEIRFVSCYIVYS